jgi:hypothetical protein
MKSASDLFSFDFSLGDSLENYKSKNIDGFKLNLVFKSFKPGSNILEAIISAS